MLDTVGCSAGIKSVLHKTKVLDGKIQTMLLIYYPSANYLIIMNHIINLYVMQKYTLFFENYYEQKYCVLKVIYNIAEAA